MTDYPKATHGEPAELHARECGRCEELEQRLATAEALLREACIGYENAQDYSGDKRLRLVPIFVAWYERAKGACGE